MSRPFCAMASKAKLREMARRQNAGDMIEIDETEIRQNRLELPCEWRAIYWVTATLFVAAGAMMMAQLSSVSETLFYSTSEVNAQMASRLERPFGAGDAKVQRAEIRFSEGVASIVAMVRGETYEAQLDVSGNLRYDAIKDQVLVDAENTLVHEAGQIGTTRGDRVAGTLEGYNASDGVRGFVRAVVDFGTGETFARNNFSTKAKNAVWAMPLFQVPSADRQRVKELDVWAALPKHDGIELKLSGREFGPGAAVGFVFFIVAGVCLLLLWSNPDLGRR